MKKILIATTILVILLVVTLSSVSAIFRLCMDYGQVINYCNNYKPPFTCDHRTGCEKCISEYNTTENCYVHTYLEYCYDLPDGCSPLGNITIDKTPPVITMNNPALAEGTVYNSRTVLLDLKVNEESDIYYTNLVTGRGRWTPVCTDCLKYNQTRSFEEGLNQLQFRAKDSVGNIAYKNVSFFIDSKKPIITKTEPAKGLTKGDFYIEFKEDNPKHLYITYGNYNKGFSVQELNINNSCKSDVRSGKYSCDASINLSAYNGMEMSYWVNLTDIANTRVDSRKPITVTIDTTDPVINNLSKSIDKTYVSFKINITEKNFEEATYSYRDTLGKLKYGTLCSKLKNGICEKKLSFKAGHYDLSVQVTDGAGNSVGQSVIFDIA